MAQLTSVSQSIVVRGTAILWGLYGFWTWAITLIIISMEGFPDSYITPYASITERPLTVLAWLALAQGLYFLVRGMRRKTFGAVALCLQLVLAAALTVVPIEVVHACPRWDACSQAYLTVMGDMIDDGQGG